MGTAYPIAYDETGIYAASGHDMQRLKLKIRFAQTGRGDL